VARPAGPAPQPRRIEPASSRITTVGAERRRRLGRVAR
jgi:hypothetical protein